MKGSRSNSDDELDILTKERVLPEEFIEKYKYRLNWKLVCQYQKLSEEFIEKYESMMDWKLICQYQKLSRSFIEKYKYKVDLELLFLYQRQSKSFIEKDKVDLNRQQPERSYECCCCFGSYPQDQIAKCNNNHMICKGCINTGTKTAVGEMKLFKCPHMDKCDQTIDESIINKFVSDDGLVNAYSTMSMNINIDSIDGLHKCKYCDYAAIIEGNQCSFFCEKCRKPYCFKCGEELHEGQICKQKFHDEAEELTKKHIISCCGRYIMRGDACNKLTCTCGKNWCWYCKVEVDDHSHFVDLKFPVDGKCPMYGDPPEPSVIKSSKDKPMKKKQRENQGQSEQKRLEEEELSIQLEIRRIEKVQKRLEEEELSIQLAMARNDDEQRRFEDERMRQLDMIKNVRARINGQRR
jgi:hypothetical protein